MDNERSETVMEDLMLLNLEETEITNDVCAVALALPDDVYEWVTRNVLFYCASDSHHAVHFRHMLPTRFAGTLFVPPDFNEDNPEFALRIIAFNHDLRENPEGHRQFVVAHEIAHAYLGHGDNRGDEYVRTEAEADAQAALWGFHRPESA